MVIRFGDFELDEGRFELRRRGEVVQVQRRVLETILYLAMRAGRLVTREELLSGPWGGTVVGDAAIARAIKEARAVLDDTGESPSTIVTVRGVGFRFEAQLSEPSSAGVSSGSRHPSGRAFVGRESELAQLGVARAEAFAGHGNLVLVSGPPGIGKSTLLEHFFERANSLGTEVHWGRCFEAQGTPPYWPWPELLRSYADRHGTSSVTALAADDLAEIASIAPGLSSRLGAPPSEVAEGPYSAFRALDAIARFWRRASERAPLALVLEDVHLAESAALDLLFYLQRLLWDSKLLLVATCRSAEGRDRKQLRALLDGELAHARTLLVSGLTKSEVSRWFDSLGGAADARELSERVARTTDGHPLLITNLLRALPSDFGAADLEQALARELFIPENLSTSIGKELERLQPEVIDLVKTASVLGEELWLPVLADLMQVAPADLGPALDRALRAGVLQRHESGRLRFTHALIREHLYRELDAAHRLSLHAIAASAFSARLADHPELVIEAAHHAVAASPCVRVDETVELLVKAASWARRRLAFGLAAEHLGFALQTLDLGGPAPRKRAGLLLDLAQNLHLAGRAEEAVRAYQELYELSAANDDHNGKAESLVGEYDVRREAIIADGVFQQRLRDTLQGCVKRGPQLAKLLATSVVVTPFLEATESRSRSLEIALHAARESGDLAARLASLHAASRVEFYDDATRALPLADEFKEVAARGAALDKLVDATMWRADCLLRLGRGMEFAREVSQLEDLASRIASPQFSYIPVLYQCLSRYLAGDLAGAQRAARAAWAIGAPSLGILADALFSAQLQWVALDMDGAVRTDLLREAIERADFVLTRLPGFDTLRMFTARARFEVGDAAEAERWLDQARTNGSFLQRSERNGLLCASAVAHVACRRGDRVAAAALRRVLRPFAGLQVTGAYAVCTGGPVSHWLGRLDLVLGDGEATGHFERAIAESERACSRTWKAWSELGLAEALSKRGTGEDLERARALREGVRRTATELDLPRLLSVVEGRVAFLAG
jgi:DNA-binding winged helix-turn-helix (wHTH) protein/tetratricopeptide (TPR) repeat protein